MGRLRCGHVREVRTGDIEYVAARMRAADVREVRACSGLEPLAALQWSVGQSGLACTVMGVADTPVALYGITPLDDLTGSVWLLGTDELTEKPLRRQFLEQGRKYFDLLHAYRPLLCNYVDERNTLHVRWLRWSGCTFICRHATFGVEGRPFLEFVRIKP